MKKKTVLLLVVAVLLIAAGGAAYWYFVLNSSNDNSASQTTQSQASQPASDKDVAALIGSISYLSSFNQALQTANLTDSLTGAGPFTVFAPSNTAFSSLPSGTLSRLEKPENIQSLADILNYHIAAGSLPSSQLTNGQKVKTVNGQEVIISVEGSNVYVTSAKGDKALVTRSDIKAKNGIIHVINTVLLPQ